MKRFEIMKKFYSSKTSLKIAGGGMHAHYTRFLFYLVASLSSYHEKAISALYELA